MGKYDTRHQENSGQPIIYIVQLENKTINYVGFQNMTSPIIFPQTDRSYFESVLIVFIVYINSNI